jgi:exodeoxyribonuclease V alpha subunit
MKAPERLGAATARYHAEQAREPPAGIDATTYPLDEEDFEPRYLGWEIARCAPRLDASEQVAVAALAAACVGSIRTGSTRVGCEGAALAAALQAAGGGDSLTVAARLFARAAAAAPGDPVSDVLGRPGERKPLIVDGAWLYTERMHALEASFCARARERIARPIETDSRAVQRAVAAVASSPQALTDEQKRAVRAALGSPLSLITGGPGSGKTATAVAVVRALAWMGTSMASVAIAAPTGKAAQRLSDAIHQGLAAPARSTPRDLADAGLGASALVPQTLHRLLGWSPSRGRFARHEGDPLPHKVIVVDEASMIDLAMMDRLLRAARPEARLVLFGDADQLPSIDAGAVFRDLCAGLGAARLTKNLRVASDAAASRIVGAARSINAGTLGDDFAASVQARASVATMTLEGVEHLTAPWPEAGADFLDRWWSARIAPDAEFARRVSRTYRLRGGRIDDADLADLRALFEGHARSRILCATRVRGFSTGADAIGDQLLAKLRAVVPGRSSRGRDLPAGAPVIVQRNDYERGLFNGDQGMALLVDAGRSEAPEPMVVFPRRDSYEAFPLDSAGDVAPAFAMTVHKAQGSEFDHVAVVLPETDLPILTRELLYTAITRARRSVALIGSQDLLARAVARTMLRQSGVAEKLKKT